MRTYVAYDTTVDFLTLRVSHTKRQLLFLYDTKVNCVLQSKQKGRTLARKPWL